MLEKMKKTVAFCTLGCKVNQYETNAMIEQFMRKSYEIKEFNEKADIYIINTCTVTNIADRKSRQMLRRVKEINPSAIVVACGCYAQVAREELEKIEDIDLIYGTNEKNKIAEYIEQWIAENESYSSIEKKDIEQNNNSENLKKSNEKFLDAKNTNSNLKNAKRSNSSKSKVTDVMYQKEFLDFGTTDYTEKTRAVIKVQDGCDRFCTYCIIPYARGHVRSRKIESVIAEIKEIAKKHIIGEKGDANG